MDRHVAVVIVRIGVVVEVARKADIDSTKCVDHVAKRHEVDRDVPVEREPRHRADLVLRRVSTAGATGVLRGDAADDVGVRNLVSGVDLLVPDPAWRVLKVHRYREVARNRREHHPIACRVDGDGHDRVRQVGRVVLIAAHPEQQDVDLLAVLKLVRDRALRRLDRLHDLTDRVDVMPRGRGDEIVNALVREGGADDHRQQEDGRDRRGDRPGQAVGDVVAGSPGPRPGPLHAHGDSSVQA